MEEELKKVIRMDLYQDIRKLYVRETSKREIARKLGISRNTVRSGNTVKESIFPVKRHIATGEALS